MANVVFALDSIPAIFGLTQDAYVVFTANAFALMGLRQLYFLIGGLLERIVYLNVGLVGDPRLHRRQAGASRHCTVAASTTSARCTLPEIGIATSLGFIVATLAVTAVASLVKLRMTPVPADDE